MATKTTAVIGGQEWQLSFRPTDMKYMREMYDLDFRKVLADIGSVTTQLGDKDPKTAVNILAICDIIAPLLATMTRRDPKHEGKNPKQIVEFFEDQMEFDNLLEYCMPVFSCMSSTMQTIKDPSTTKKDPGQLVAVPTANPSERS